MSFKKLNSCAKINLSLNVIKRLPNKYHQIESLLTFIQLSDETKYEGGNLEFGITDKSGKNNYTAPRTRGSITIYQYILKNL